MKISAARCVCLWKLRVHPLRSPWTCGRTPATPCWAWTPDWGASWSTWTGCRRPTGGWTLRLPTGVSGAPHAHRTGPSRSRLFMSSVPRYRLLLRFLIMQTMKKLLETAQLFAGKTRDNTADVLQSYFHAVFMITLHYINWMLCWLPGNGSRCA